MARRRLRITGFARFLFAMIFIVPAAYIGASYINGEDGIENIKELVGLNETNSTQTIEEAPTNPRPSNTQEETNTSNSTIEFSSQKEQLERDLEYYKKRTVQLEQEVDDLKKKIWERDQEIARLQE